ncbi:MAG TPA: hypothetical protein VF449_02115 [Parvibaculum sp.]
MNGIRRIASVSQSSSTRTRDAGQARAASDATGADMNPPPRSNAGLGGATASFRPAAGFLAQYVDQHYAWPRAPQRKASERQRATRAYIVADMLQDLLAETRRARPTDERL